MQNNDLVAYANGQAVAPKQDRQLARQGKQVYDEVRLTALKADGAMALAGHIMQGLVNLDAHRRALAGDDPVTNQMLAEIEISCVQRVKQLQNNLFNGWKL